ncbi:MAG: FHA domain-containing protein [Steroidobacteraceae bacterium]
MLGAELRDGALLFARDGERIDPPAGAAHGPLWVALAPPPPTLALGEVLGTLRAAGHVVQGFVDRAALLAAATGLSTQLAVLDLSRQQLSVSMVAVDDSTASLRRQVPLPGGEQALHLAWLELAASTLVQQTRFDPLHDQRREAQLRGQLPALAALAQHEGQASCEVDTGSARLSLTLTRDQFAAAAARVLQPLAAALQALSAASEDCTLLVPAALPDIPGMDAALASARFSRALRFADDLAARAASLLPPPGSLAASGAVSYRTQLPRFAAPMQQQLSPLLLAGAGPQVMATHVVYQGQVLPISAPGLVVGREPDGAHVLRLPAGAAGVSRRHCTLRQDGLRAQVIDHSTHGSFVDGMRVRGRALLAAGSVLRVGEPGIELQLVALHPGAV